MRSMIEAMVSLSKGMPKTVCLSSSIMHSPVRFMLPHMSAVSALRKSSCDFFFLDICLAVSRFTRTDRRMAVSRASGTRYHPRAVGGVLEP